MSVADIPIWLLFVITTLLVVATIELGYIVGRRARQRSEDEKESPVSAIAGTVLALLAFILAFTFGIVADRYDARKGLVREQAMAIRTAYESSDFLPEPLRDESKELYRQYIVQIVQAGHGGHLTSNSETLSELRSIEAQIWNMAVVDVRAGDDTDISSFYVQSVDDMRNLLAMRVAVSVESRIPNGFWVVLYVLIGLGMFAVGYQTAIAASRRTSMMVVLALAFSMVVTLIAALDNPEQGIVAISQQPLIDLKTEIIP